EASAGGELLAALHDPLEDLGGRPRVHRLGRHLDALDEALGDAGRHQADGGVHDRRVPPGALLAFEDPAEDADVVGDVPAGQVGELRAADAEVQIGRAHV